MNLHPWLFPRRFVTLSWTGTYSTVWGVVEVIGGCINDLVSCMKQKPGLVSRVSAFNDHLLSACIFF